MNHKTYDRHRVSSEVHNDVFKSLFSIKLKTQREMDKCLGVYVLSMLNKCKINTSNGYIATNEIETITKILPTKTAHA